ncbi:MAG: 50S ribosomal protein L11 [archaeon]
MGELKVMVDAGRASAGAPLGPALGPTGVNIGEVVAKINEKTASLVGMKVPVTIITNKDKSFEITVGMPPMSALIKKECKAEKGAANPKADKVGNLTMKQVISIAKMKYDNITAKSMKAAAKEVMGTCDSMGVSIDGLRAKDAIKEFNTGKYDAEFK